jgi:hypothetical protein
LAFWKMKLDDFDDFLQRKRRLANAKLSHVKNKTNLDAHIIIDLLDFCDLNHWHLNLFRL